MASGGCTTATSSNNDINNDANSNSDNATLTTSTMHQNGRRRNNPHRHERNLMFTNTISKNRRLLEMQTDSQSFLD